MQSWVNQTVIDLQAIDARYKALCTGDCTKEALEYYKTASCYSGRKRVWMTAISIFTFDREDGRDQSNSVWSKLKHDVNLVLRHPCITPDSSKSSRQKFQVRREQVRSIFCEMQRQVFL